jgi:DNA-directed RNA polymerase subunit RPC12/RpoP
MKNYMCKKCKTLIQSASRPSGFNCPSGGMHQWSDMGNVGTENHQCKKCGTLVQSKGRPSGFDCPAGGMHQWSKL